LRVEALLPDRSLRPCASLRPVRKPRPRSQRTTWGRGVPPTRNGRVRGERDRRRPGPPRPRRSAHGPDESARGPGAALLASWTSRPPGLGWRMTASDRRGAWKCRDGLHSAWPHVCPRAPSPVAAAWTRTARASADGPPFRRVGLARSAPARRQGERVYVEVVHGEKQGQGGGAGVRLVVAGKLHSDRGAWSWARGGTRDPSAAPQGDGHRAREGDGIGGSASAPLWLEGRTNCGSCAGRGTARQRPGELSAGAGELPTSCPLYRGSSPRSARHGNDGWQGNAPPDLGDTPAGAARIQVLITP